MRPTKWSCPERPGQRRLAGSSELETKKKIHKSLKVEPRQMDSGLEKQANVPALLFSAGLQEDGEIPLIARVSHTLADAQHSWDKKDSTPLQLISPSSIFSLCPAFSITFIHSFHTICFYFLLS